MLSSFGAEQVHGLISVIKRTEQSESNLIKLSQDLTALARQHEIEIERTCSLNHQDFMGSVNSLLKVRQNTLALTQEILNLNTSIETSTEQLSAQKRILVDSRRVHQNISDVDAGARKCLHILGLVNRLHGFLGIKEHFSALRILDELRNLRLRDNSHFDIGTVIESEAPNLERLIADAVTADLHTWLYRVREISQYIGELAFYHTEQRRSNLREGDWRLQDGEIPRLNSAIELALDERIEFDLLDNDDVQVDFTPLFECIHIQNTLGHSERFRTEYRNTRKQQRELLFPTNLSFSGDDFPGLSGLLEDVAGFAIVEKTTMWRAPTLRSALDVSVLVTGPYM